MARQTTKGFSAPSSASLPARLPQDADSQTSDEQSPGLRQDSSVIASARDLGSMMREIRRSRGLSQQAFADLAGVGRRFVSDLEGGKATIEMDKALMVARSIGIVFMAKRA